VCAFIGGNITMIKQMWEDSKKIHEGSYGCVLSPPLKCKKSKARDHKSQRTVGKVIRIQNSKIELSVGTLVKSIPGWQRYYIIAEDDNCETKNFSTHRELYQQLCKVYKYSSDSQLTQLVSPYAGAMLRVTAFTPTFDFVGSLRHMLEGVSLLNKQGICHFDLHDGNVLVDFKETFRIIDFGSAFLGDQVDQGVVKKHTYEFSPKFPPESPELSVMTGIAGGMTMSDGIERTMNAIGSKKELYELAYRLIGIDRFTEWRHLIEFWKEDETWKGESWVLFFKTYWRKWDSWAIGVMFLEILKKCFLMPSFLRTTWPEEGGRIKIVLKGLLTSHPDKRMTAEEALVELDRV
jgi:serine/threonine protein kinase